MEALGLTGVALNPDFWRGRRVFVTGHTGFKGAWLALWLDRLGAQVTGFALPPSTSPSLFDAARVHELVHGVHSDVRDLPRLESAMRDARPEVVLHLAAQALVRPSYDDPVSTYASNVMGTVHVCEAVRRTRGVRALVCVTSDKCYANHGADRAFVETDAMGGHDPYSASKGCAELVSASYRDAFFAPAEYARHGMALATVRAGNVIGGGDWSSDRLLPDLLRAADAQRSVHIRRPLATRPWQHVLDALAGYLLLAQRLALEGPQWGGGWNFGPDASDVRSVRDIVRALQQRVPVRAVFEPQPSVLHEAASLRLDSSRARSRLGWRAAWSVDQALDRTVQWHLGWRSGADARSLCEAQIDAHGHARATGRRERADLREPVALA